MSSGYLDAAKGEIDAAETILKHNEFLTDERMIGATGLAPCQQHYERAAALALVSIAASLERLVENYEAGR